MIFVIADPKGGEPLLVVDLPSIPAVGNIVSFREANGRVHTDTIKSLHWVFNREGNLAKTHVMATIV